jgi:hypothetical protein
VLFIRSVERCKDAWRKDSNGKVSYREECRWDEVGRQTPPFQLDLEDAQQPMRIRVINQNYKLEGAMRKIYPSSKQLVQGFQDGDRVLVIGIMSASGVHAESVYGGTRELYIRNTRLLGLGLAALAATLLVAAIVMVLHMGP